MQLGGWGFLASQQVAGSLLPICASLSPTDEVQGLDGVGGQVIPKIPQWAAKKVPFPRAELGAACSP